MPAVRMLFFFSIFVQCMSPFVACAVQGGAFQWRHILADIQAEIAAAGPVPPTLLALADEVINRSTTWSVAPTMRLAPPARPNEQKSDQAAGHLDPV